MNTYTVSIDVAALSQEAAFQAVEKVLYSRTRASDEAAIMRAVPGFECFVGIRQEGQRVEQPETSLPKNCRLISVKEAVEMYECYMRGGFIVEGGFLTALSYHYSVPVMGRAFDVVFSAEGTCFCLDTKGSAEFRDLLHAKHFCNIAEAASGEDCVGCASCSERAGGKVDVADVAPDFTGQDSVCVDEVNPPVCIDNTDELGHAASVAENNG